jgi:hypothetical protein
MQMLVLVQFHVNMQMLIPCQYVNVAMHGKCISCHVFPFRLVGEGQSNEDDAMGSNGGGQG